MLFYEPKLLKLPQPPGSRARGPVSVLFYEPKLLKVNVRMRPLFVSIVSVLFYEPKLLKSARRDAEHLALEGFSALLRAEIVEMDGGAGQERNAARVSVLFYEPKLLKLPR